MATSRKVDAIGTIEAGEALVQYNFVVLEATGWMVADANSQTTNRLVGVVQQAADAGEAVEVMIKGQSKLLSNAAFAGLTVGDTVGLAAAGVPAAGAVAAGANVDANVIGWVTEVAAAGFIGSIFLAS